MAKRKTKKTNIEKFTCKWDGLRYDITGKKDGIYVNARLDPTVVNAAIEEIENRATDGKCSKSDLVSFARKNKRHPLHSAFQWDDKKGAEQYRNEQAGLILRTLVFVYTKNESTVPHKIRAHVNTPANANGKSYASIFNAVKNEADMQFVVERMESLRNSYTKQLRGLAEFDNDYPIIARLIAHEDKGDKLILRAKQTFTVGPNRRAAKKSTKKKKATTTRKKKVTRKKR